MTKFIAPFCFLTIFISCNIQVKDKKGAGLTSFIFSYSALHSAYSLRITESDTIYFIRRFPEPSQTYYSVMPPSRQDSVLQIINEINFNKYDSIYDQSNLEDGDSYKLILNKEKSRKWIYIHGYEAPNELYKTIESLMKIKESNIYKAIDTIVDFDDLKYIAPPNIPSPPLKH